MKEIYEDVAVPGSPRILVVDDDKMVLRTITETLMQRFEVTGTQSPKEALRILQNTPHQILLLDLMMEEMHGMDLFRAAKNICPLIRVIVMTGYASKDAAIEALKEGACDFLEKQFVHDVVMQTVSRAWEGLRTELENRKLLVELRRTNKELEVKIKEHKQAEEALRASQERYRILAENVADGVAIFQDGKFVFANDALASMFGCTGDRLIGVESVTLFRDDYKEHFRETLEQLEKGVSVEYFQAPCIGEDGREIWVEAHHSFIKWEGKPAILATFRDITESKLSQAAMEEEAERLWEENIQLRSSIKERYRFGDIIGKSPAMQEVYDLILKAAATNVSTVVYGESGTGKELVARAIHETSNRRDKNFVAVNCGAIPEGLLESEFFGHRKGAFTDAYADKRGFLDLADGGTLFLDEVAELPLSLQIKLLRALEGGGYTPVGDRRTRTSDFRIIAATNKNLADQVNNGLMRNDFFYRIHVIPIALPPLRERKEDIPLLVDNFLQSYGDGKKPFIPAKVMEALLNYDWTGNVRELQNVLHRYLTVKTIDFIGAPTSNTLNVEAAPDKDKNLDQDHSLRANMENVERDLITKTLDQAHWNRSKAASLLGLSRRALFRKMKNLGIT